MSEREPITTELRKELERTGRIYDVHKPYCERISTLCDAIDAVHARLEQENDELGKTVDATRETDAWKMGFDEGFASADDWLAQHEDAMAEHGWYRERGADGLTIRIGDVMESEYITRLEVSAIGAGCFFALNNTDGRFHQFDSQQFTHHHAPTVEDVLREFAMAVCKDDALTIRKDVVDAAKLQLKEDA